MKRPAEDFGNSGVVRHFCDNPNCEKPITLRWQGKRGEYCSNRCLNLTESEGEHVTTDESTAATETTNASSPIQAGKTSTKSSTKSAGSKKAVKPKTVKPKKEGKPKAKKGAAKVREGGAAEKAIALLHKGATIENLMSATGWIKNSVMWNISITFRKKMGLDIKTRERKNGEKEYFIT